MTDWGDLGPKDQAKVTRLFRLIDLDKDGIISYNEVRTANGGDPDGTMQKMFKKIDTNGDGQASEDEWIKFWVALMKARGAKAFDKFIKALASAAMANNPPPKQVQGQTASLSAKLIGLASEVFGLMDLDANGGVSKSEFMLAHGDDAGFWRVLDQNSDDSLSLRELLDVLGTMQSNRGHEAVDYFLKTCLTVIKDNQEINPKARGVSLAGRCNHVFHQRAKKVRVFEDEISSKDSSLVAALEQRVAAPLVHADPSLTQSLGPQLLMVACWKGDTECVLELLDQDVDPNAKDADGFSALMYAALSDKTNAMKALYKGDTDKKLQLDAVDCSGATALHVAACEGNMTAGGSIMAWSGGADKLSARLASLLDNNQMNALMLAAANGHSTFVAFLLNPPYEID